MNSLVYPFTITADELNAADTEEVVVANLPSNSNFVLVPTRLEVFREEGDAYVTTTHNNRREIDYRNVVNDFHKGGAFLVVRSAYDAGTHNATQDDLFIIPIHGFLDTTGEVSLVATPIGGRTFRSGATNVVVKASCAISGGSGTLTCKLYVDQHLVPRV